MPGTLIEFYMPVVFFASVKPLIDEQRCDPGTYIIRETDTASALNLLTIEGQYVSTLHCVPTEINYHSGVQFTLAKGSPLPRLHRILLASRSGWEVTHSYTMPDRSGILTDEMKK